MTKLEAYVISFKANRLLFYVEAGHSNLWPERNIGAYEIILGLMNFLGIQYVATSLYLLISHALAFMV